MSLTSKQSRVSQFKVWIPHEDTEVRSSISASILISAVKVQIATRFVVIPPRPSMEKAVPKYGPNTERTVPTSQSDRTPKYGSPPSKLMLSFPYLRALRPLCTPHAHPFPPTAIYIFFLEIVSYLAPLPFLIGHPDLD